MAVSLECPALPDGNQQQGLRSLWHLSRHLTARADDNHAAPLYKSRRTGQSLAHPCRVQAHRIKPHVPPLVRAPVNSFEFHRCRRTPQVEYLTISLGNRPSCGPTAGIQRLLCGLPGYLILFDTHTFEPQRQLHSGHLPSRSEFFVISMHFTATPRIPASLRALKTLSFNCNYTVGPCTFTTDLKARLRSL